MILLIDAAYMRSENLDVTINVNEAKFIEPAVRDAQEFDLRKLIGDEFYNAIIANPGSYSDLLDRTVYTHNGNGYINPGVKPMLARYAYARYKRFSGAHDTASGTREKLNPFSNSSPDKLLIEMINMYKSQGLEYANEVIDYLNRKSELYPLWKKNGCATASPRRAKIIYSTDKN